MILATDNRMRSLSDFHLVLFWIDGVVVRFSDMTPEQQGQANKIYPVTFEARRAQRDAREAPTHPAPAAEKEGNDG